MSPLAFSNPEHTIAIAGGGIIGLSIAWRLAQRGCRVTVFEKGQIGGEASWAGAGMLAPGGEIETACPLASLANESRRLYGEFVRELETASGIDVDYQECGALDLAYSEPEFEALEKRAELQIGLGIRSKTVDPKAVSTVWPRVEAKSLYGARFYPDDAIVDPRTVVIALDTACKTLGVSIMAQCAVSRISISAAGTAVETAQGSAFYSAAVIAAGAWSSSIAIPGMSPLPASEPVKGHLIGYRQPTQTCPTILRCGPTYLLQRASGLLIAGTSVEHVGFDRSIDSGVVAELSARAGRIFPHLAETTPSEIWTGFRPASDELHVGAYYSPRLYLAYGHYRNGILLAPVTAKKLAEEISANLGKR